MAERRSAVAAIAAASPGTSGTTLRDVTPASIIQVQAWPDSLPTVQTVLSEFLGMAPPAIGSAVGGDGAIMAAIAPGRFLLSSDAGDLAERLAAALTASDGAVTDLSHGRTVLRLEGAEAVGVLSACVAIDLDSALFPLQRVAQTAIHHIDVLVHRRSETSFDLWVLRSFAEALAEWLLDARREAGVVLVQ